MFHSWAAYLNDEGTPLGRRELYLDKDDAANPEMGLIEDCPFPPDLKLTSALESGFNGKIQPCTILRQFDSSSVGDAETGGSSHMALFVDTQCYMALSKDKTKLTLSIRGSESRNDWFINASSMKTFWEPESDFKRGNAGTCACLDSLLCNPKHLPMVHLGWYNAFLSMKSICQEFQKEAVKPTVKEVLFCGHSQGGAMAILALMNFLENNTDNMEVREPRTLKRPEAPHAHVGQRCEQRAALFGSVEGTVWERVAGTSDMQATCKRLLRATGSQRPLFTSLPPLCTHVFGLCSHVCVATPRASLGRAR